jgi:hypothetical protein
MKKERKILQVMRKVQDVKNSMVIPISELRMARSKMMMIHRMVLELLADILKIQCLASRFSDRK